jgi:hypothetical protein
MQYLPRLSLALSGKGERRHHEKKIRLSAPWRRIALACGRRQ